MQNTSLPNCVQRIKILVVSVSFQDLQPIAWPKPLEKLVPGEIWIDGILDSQCASGLVRPCTRNIFDCVATTTNQDERNILLANELHAVGMSVHSYVEASELVTCERICTALEYYGRRSVHLEDFGNHL